jgi:hypothetical protein
MTTTEITRRPEISQPAARRSSKRGEHIEKENRFDMMDNERMKA